MILTYNNGEKDISVVVDEIKLASQTGFYTLIEEEYIGITITKVINTDDDAVDMLISPINRNQITIE